MPITYGMRFRFLRERAGLNQEGVSRVLKLKRERGSSVSNIELRQVYPPARILTIQRHADALGCHVWELLAGVPGRYDLLRARVPLSSVELDALLWGIPYLTPKHRAELMETAESFLRTSLPPQAGRPPTGQSAPVPRAKVIRTARKKKSA